MRQSSRARTVSSSRRAASRSPARAWNPAATAWACAGAPIHQRTASAAMSRSSAGSVAGADDLEPLRHAYVAGVAVADGLAEGGGLGAEPLAGVDVAVEQRERGLPGAEQVVVAGLAQPLGEVRVLGEGGAEGRGAVLQLRGRRQQQGLGVPFRVVGAFGQVGDLGGDRGPRGGGAGGPQGVVAGRAGSWPAWPGRPGYGRSRPPARPAVGPVGGRRARSVAAGGPARRSPSPRWWSRCRSGPAGRSAARRAARCGAWRSGRRPGPGPAPPRRADRPGRWRWPGSRRCRAAPGPRRHRRRAAAGPPRR